MRTAITALAILAVSTALAGAAEVTNKDGESLMLVLTIDGVRGEIVIESGGTSAVCENGCFLTLPNGDRAALAGDETVSIVNGGIVIE